jgi:hypothetical protein
MEIYKKKLSQQGLLAGGRLTSRKDHGLNPCDMSRMYFG